MKIATKEEVERLILCADMNWQRMRSPRARDAARLGALLTAGNGYLLTQHYGCCGFAAVLMSLLAHKEGLFREFCAIVFTPDSDRAKPDVLPPAVRALVKPDGSPIPLRKRLEWRRGNPAWATVPKPLDLELCVALMILFKEYVKKGKLSTWDECRTYSESWSEWSNFDKKHTAEDLRAAKLEKEAAALEAAAGAAASSEKQAKLAEAATKRKEATQSRAVAVAVRKAKSGENYRIVKLPMSAKRGDLGLTAAALLRLIDFVYKDMFGVNVTVGHGPVNVDLISLPASNFWKGPVNWLVNEYLTASKKPKFMGGIVALASNTSEMAKLKDYHYIVHWVYVPSKQEANVDLPETLVMWTWGTKEYNFGIGPSSFLIDDGYTPAYAVWLYAP